MQFQIKVGYPRQLTIIVRLPYLQVLNVCMKISRKKLHLLNMYRFFFIIIPSRIQYFLHSICIALDTISNLQRILHVQKNVCKLKCKHYSTKYSGLQHLWVLISAIVQIQIVPSKSHMFRSGLLKGHWVRGMLSFSAYILIPW